MMSRLGTNTNSTSMLKRRLRVFENLNNNADLISWKGEEQEKSQKSLDKEDDCGEFKFDLDSLTNDTLPSDKEEEKGEKEELSQNYLDNLNFELLRMKLNSYTNEETEEKPYQVLESNTLVLKIPRLRLTTEEIFSLFNIYGELESFNISTKDKFPGHTEIMMKFFDLRSAKRAFNETSYNFEKLLNTFEKENFSIQLLDNNKNEIFSKFYLMLTFSDKVKVFSTVIRFIELHSEIERLMICENPLMKVVNILVKFYNSKEKRRTAFLLSRVVNPCGQLIYTPSMLRMMSVCAERGYKEGEWEGNKSQRVNFNLFTKINPINHSEDVSLEKIVIPPISAITPMAEKTKLHKLSDVIQPVKNLKPTPKTTLNCLKANKENKVTIKSTHNQNKRQAEKKGPYKIVYDQNYTGIKKRNTPDEERKKYIISVQNIINEKDNRTTLMIKNIPTFVTQVDLLKIINKKYSSAYNFFYLPIDFTKKLNAGYAFVNFRNSKCIINFFQEFDNQPWDIPGCKNKICYLSYARIQGFRSICEHFQKSSIMKQVDEKVKPIIYID